MQDKSPRNGLMLGRVLKEWRYAERRTVRDVAKWIGVNYATLNRLEHGENLDGRTLATILKFLLKEE